MLKAIKIRIYPNNEQEHYIANLLGSCRFVYNKLLHYKNESYESSKKSISFAEAGKYLTSLKSDFPFLKEVHSKVLQQSAIDLDKAFNNFFKKISDKPKFKSKRDTKSSCRFPNDAFMGIKGNRISLIKVLKDIHFKCSVRDERILNENQNNVKSLTLSKTRTGKYFISVLIDTELIKSFPETDSAIGIDLGIKDFVITSDGQKFDNLKLNKKNKNKTARLQRWLSRTKKGSKGREKARVKLAKHFEKITNKKEYYLHSVVNQLLNENQIIVIENLNVKGMMKNHKLAASIQDVSWYRFKSILQYKAIWNNKEVIEINRFFPSSKQCGCCGAKNDDLKLNDRFWTCLSCGSEHDRDINAANNILKEGLKLKIGLSSPESTPMDSKPIGSGKSLKKGKEIGKECKVIEIH